MIFDLTFMQRLSANPWLAKRRARAERLARCQALVEDFHYPISYSIPTEPPHCCQCEAGKRNSPYCPCGRRVQ